MSNNNKFYTFQLVANKYMYFIIHSPKRTKGKQKICDES